MIMRILWSYYAYDYEHIMLKIMIFCIWLWSYYDHIMHMIMSTWCFLLWYDKYDYDEIMIIVCLWLWATYAIIIVITAYYCDPIIIIL